MALLRGVGSCHQRSMAIEALKAPRRGVKDSPCRTSATITAIAKADLLLPQLHLCRGHLRLAKAVALMALAATLVVEPRSHSRKSSQ